MKRSSSPSSSGVRASAPLRGASSGAGAGDHPAARRRAAERERRHRDIIAAAERVFGERGVGAASMDEIAREAAVAAGTLYLYFPGKESLFFAAFVPKVRALFCETEAVWGADGALRERLRRILGRHMEFVRDHRGFHEFLLSLGSPSPDAPGDFGELRELCEAHLECERRAFARAQEAGEVRGGIDAGFLALAWRSLAWGMMRDAIENRRGGDFESLVEPILEVFWNGVAA